MNKKIAIVIALCIVALALPAMAQEREWLKRGGQLDFDGTRLAEWSHYATSDESSPFLTRRFLLLDGGFHVVVRSTTDLTTKAQFIEVELLESGESISFDKRGTDMTISLGGEEMTIYRHQIPDNVPRLGEPLESQGRAFVEANSTQLFQDALAMIREVGCSHATELYMTAYMTAMFYDYKCSVPADDKTSGLVIQKQFDTSTPPTPLEIEFGEKFAL